MYLYLRSDSILVHFRLTKIQFGPIAIKDPKTSQWFFVHLFIKKFEEKKNNNKNHCLIKNNHYCVIILNMYYFDWWTFIVASVLSLHSIVYVVLVFPRYEICCMISLFYILQGSHSKVYIVITLIIQKITLILLLFLLYRLNVSGDCK